MPKRKDGSYQSAGVPGAGTPYYDITDRDYNNYRCMVQRIYFTDDPDNLTYGNKQVTYDCIILGGRKEGQVIPNCKLMSQLGGEFNFHERVLRASEGSFQGDQGGQRAAEKTGDIVYVSFIGRTSNPVIIGLGTQPKDETKTGATKVDGMRYVQEFNGINTLINKNGDLIITRKGGVYNEEGQFFTPAEAGREAIISLLKDTIKVDDTKNSITLDKASGNTSIKGGTTVAIGAGGTEVIQQVVDLIDKFITVATAEALHTHLGNLGFPTAATDKATDWTTLKTDITAIKDKLDAIKGIL